MSEQLWRNAPEGECTDADIGQTREVQEWFRRTIAEGESANDPTPYLPKGFPIDACVTSADWQSDLSYYAREAWKDAQDEDEEGD